MYLYGASGHAKVIIDILENNKIKIKGIYDDYSTNKSLFNIPILNDSSKIIKEDIFIVSIGDNKVRKKITQKLNASYKNAVHPKAFVSNIETKIEEGTVIMANAVVNSSTNIGKHCIVNTAAVVEHDCTIESYVHISPNATIAGGVTIKEGTHVGAGATVIPGVKIGKWCVIGAGSTVIENIPDYSVAVGSPAKVIKQIN